LDLLWRAPLERVLGLKELDRQYLELPEGESVSAFLEAVFEQFDVRINIAADDMAKVPREGPTVVVANHPYGGIEGLALALLLLTIRPDVRILANFLLGRIPELRELFLLVDPFESVEAAGRSLAGLRQAHRWLAEGGLLVVFPAGEVASLDLRQRAVVDPPWAETVDRLISKAQCPVIPVYFAGHNGPLFQLAGLVHPVLRTAMLPRELLARRGRPLKVCIGSPVKYSDLRTFETGEARMNFLRRRTEILGERLPLSPKPTQPRKTPDLPAAIIDPVERSRLEAEVDYLPRKNLLAESGCQEVWIADGEHIPALLTEIGRLRELTFRDVGEGTGRELDLDHFDEIYQHLFVWHREDKEVVGAYRIGCTDTLLAEDGLEGLYTSTLFRYHTRLFDSMGTALEMGRSFIQPRYQKSFAGLLLLWKGIGRFVVQNPECTTLFGPVSISADYRSSSQQLMAAFLKQNTYHHPWCKWVHPRSPFKERPSRVIRRGVGDLRDLEDVSRFIAEIEADHKGMPILLRQYLKLGGRLLGFNVDPDFSDVLDVLVMVDLRETPVKTLARYMGSEGAAAFLAHHGVSSGPT
ncbi:MAG: GNAT family N-acyltransferase, partial [Acidobacteriota bacterium]